MARKGKKKFNQEAQALPSIAICNDGSQIVYIWRRLSSFGCQLSPSVPVFTIMQLLGFEEPLHLVWNRVVRVVAKVGRHLIGAGED